MIEILMVEDDPGIGRTIHDFLQTNGFRVHWAQTLKCAGELSREPHSIALVLLDLTLPDGYGLKFLKELRDGGSGIPVIVVTALNDEDTAVGCFEAGASDFVRKPCWPRELLARIRICLGRSQPVVSELRIGKLKLLPARRRLVYDGRDIDLNRREFEIITHLMENVGEVVSRETLLDLVDQTGRLYDRTIDSHVSHIRARLRQAGVKTIQIVSVYGVGYRLEER